MTAEHLELASSVAEAERAADEAEANLCVGDVWYWMCYGTKTRDEQDPVNPNKPFPRLPYIWAMVKIILAEAFLFIEKSRTVMGTWCGCAVYAHEGFTTPGMRYVFQSEDEDRAINCIDYVKALWDNSLPLLKERWPLARPLELQAKKEFKLANGTIFIAIVGGADKIRSMHPTRYLMDEGAVIQDGADCLDVAQAANPLGMLIISSAKPGWFRDATELAKPAKPAVKLPPGMAFRRANSGAGVLRVHYSADPKKRDPEWIAKQRKKYTLKANWNLEMEIQYDAKKGSLVYPEFDPAIHVCDPSEVPERGCIYMAIDPHPRTPHFFLWVLIDRFEDWWVYREFWPSTVCGQPKSLKEADEDPVFTTAEYAEMIALLEGNKIEWRGAKDGQYGVLIENGEKPVSRFMDQAGKAFKTSGEGVPVETYWDKYINAGFSILPPYKSHEVGEEKIRELLKPMPHDTKGKSPRLHISADCPELILEFSKYRYRKQAAHVEKEQPQDPLDLRSHGLDDLRYIATSDACYIESYACNRELRKFDAMVRTAAA